jgi:hypothetical protein
MQLSEAKRGRFLEVLGQTGNRRLAAEAIGVDPRLMDQRRQFDPVLDRQWTEALDQADRRLAGAAGPLDCIGGAEPMVIRRGAGGRLRIVKAGPRRWSRPVDERFFATLAATGNIAASARAVGFSKSCIDHRRRNVPGFAEKLEQALEDAEVEIEFRLAAEVRGAAVEAGAGAKELGTVTSNCPRFDIDAAIRFLKWREEKRRGGGRRGRVPREPSPDAVDEKILRKVAAIARQRAREEGNGELGTVTGNCPR